MSEINIFIKYFLYAFSFSIILFIFFIPFFRKSKIKQSIRELGPKNHYIKSGTPTMGGLVIVFTLFIIFFYSSIYEINIASTQFLMLIMPMITYASIGLIDDYMIVIKKNNNGLSPMTKLIFQIVWAAIYFFLFIKSGLSTIVNVFGMNIDFKWMYGILILLMFISTANAVNLTDGLDGLATAVIIPILSGVTIIAYERNIYISIFIIILIGTLIGFMCYNFNPAKLFMGDVGSLAIGATLANLFIILKIEVLLLVFGGVIVIETLSDIIQVTYFKLTKGKRIFLMAPLHHHYELKGKSELYIVFMFFIMSIIFSIIGLILYEYLY